PQSQTVIVGGAATFSVLASGTPPLTYQWQFNGTNLPGATAKSLGLTNVQFSQAGNYSVAVSNSLGTAASSNAALTVTPPPPCSPPAADLISWWRADGNASDAAGTNNGTLLGGVAFAA